ncbi:MAG TPA: nuclear transport factor 2 family protein [Flavisolibacter sp.]|jgi:ketosteroid isomerase-like protein|nr:nuclear transport factor 2 family protein [Flavisolibacter sp.]
MKKYFFFLLLFIGKHAFSQNVLDEMIRAEKSFAAYSVLHGTKDAFLKFADTTAIMFNKGEPVDGYQLWLGREKRPGVLNWRPRYAEIAASGDFGYTCGPWTFQPQTTADKIVATGYFFTVWKRNSEGEWKFILDVGTDAGPAMEDTTVLMQGAETRKGAEITMLEAESDFIRMFKIDSAKAYQLFLSGNALLAREATGFQNKQKLLQASSNTNKGITAFSALGSGLAPSGDLGFVYGTATMNGKKEAYLRIWRNEPKGWKIALQLLRH